MAINSHNPSITHMDVERIWFGNDYVDMKSYKASLSITQILAKNANKDCKNGESLIAGIRNKKPIMQQRTIQMKNHFFLSIL